MHYCSPVSLVTIGVWYLVWGVPVSLRFSVGALPPTGGNDREFMPSRPSIFAVSRMKNAIGFGHVVEVATVLFFG